MNKIITTAGFMLAATITGCAPYAANITPAAISHIRYAEWDCNKLRYEKQFVEESLARVSADQDSAASSDAWMVFLIGVPTSGGGVKGEVARLKGEDIAIRNAQLHAGCIVPATSSPASVAASEPDAR